MAKLDFVTNEWGEWLGGLDASGLIRFHYRIFTFNFLSKIPQKWSIHVSVALNWAIPSMITRSFSFIHSFFWMNNCTFLINSYVFQIDVPSAWNGAKS